MKQKANQKIKSGYDRCKRNVLRRCLNIASDSIDATCDGRLFMKLASETGNQTLHSYFDRSRSEVFDFTNQIKK